MKESQGFSRQPEGGIEWLDNAVEQLVDRVDLESAFRRQFVEVLGVERLERLRLAEGVVPVVVGLERLREASLREPAEHAARKTSRVTVNL